VYFISGAQTEDKQAMPDTTAFSTLINETVTISTNPETDESYETKRIHLPRKATMYSAVLPGLGQAYNRQAWKIPFIYGGFVALGIAIESNHSLYKNFKKAYIHLNDSNPETAFYNEFETLERYWVIDEFNQPSELSPSIYDAIEKSSRQRNRMIIFTAAFYVLNILDANVNAHFIDFDISEDLTINMQPMLEPATGKTFIGGVLTYNF
jgi:hypothetical protein